MKLVAFKELSLEGFLPYGAYVNLINPSTEKIGEEPIEFYRDMALLGLGGNTSVSFSICHVLKREPVINVIEYHTACGEGILPIDGDVLIHVAPATPNGVAPFDRIEVFRAPKGTLVTIKPGVWHHAPFAYQCDIVNTLIVLPERTYAHDCIVVEIPESEHLKIEGA